MIRRMLKWLIGLVILAVLVVGFVLPMLSNTEKGRAEVAKILGKGLQRDVTIGGLEIGWFFSSVAITDFEIANPAGFPAGAMLKAKSISLDSSFKEILNKKVVGSLDGSGLEVHVIRKGGKTNLDGIADPDSKKGDTSDGGDGPELDLKLALSDSRVVVEDLDKGEKLVVEGVGLTMTFTNKKGAARTALQIHVNSIERDTITVRDLDITATQAGDYLDIEKIRALLPGDGTLSGSGKMRLRNGDDWNVALTADKVAIEQNMIPMVATMFPFVSAASDQVGGSLDAKFAIKGHGLTWNAMRPTLDGTGEVALKGLNLPASSLLAQVATLAGRGDGAIALNSAGAQFGVKEGWVNFNRLSASGDKARYDLAGRVSLTGGLDLSLDLMPLVKAFGGGKTYSKIGEHISELPVKIRGTTAKPELAAPSAEDLLKGAAGGLVEKGLGKALERLGGGR